QPKAQAVAAGNDEKARALVKQGRAALQQGKLDEAKNLAAQARELKPNLNWWEDNPARLADDAQRAENARARTATASNNKPPPPPPRGTDAARSALVKARAHLAAGRFDEAFASAQSAKASQVEWGLFEDSPDRLVLDVQKARGKRDREEADRLLAEGRKLLDK